MESNCQIYKTYTTPLKNFFKIILTTSHESIKNMPHFFKNKITDEEVIKNIKKLSNSRGSDFDQILAERIKYGPTELHSIIAIIIIYNCNQNNIDTEIRIGL